MIPWITLLRFVSAVSIAWLFGRGITKLKLPAILGWLIAGMLLGPHALGILSSGLRESSSYQTLMHFTDAAVGVMIGTELIWTKLKRSGKALLLTTLTQSMATFALVSTVFCLVFSFTSIPTCLGFVFGGIALATAPAPALSVVKEFDTKGPVTSTLIPMAALDDIIGCVVFLFVISIVTGRLAEGQIPLYIIPVMICMPLLLGVFTGYLASFVLRKERAKRASLGILVGTLVLSAIFSHFVQGFFFPEVELNYMLLGMAFAGCFANQMPEERVEALLHAFYPVLGASMLLLITNLGAPLDYQLILGAGSFTAIYISMRALGKYFGAYFGSYLTGAPETVKKYLGLTLLPHSGVSLIFTSFACSNLVLASPESARVLTGTIAAAAVINEILAVMIAKKGFEWAGEMPALQKTK